MLTMDPLRSRAWTRGLVQGWKNLRNPRAWAASFGSLLGVLLLLQLLATGLIGIAGVQSLLLSHTDIKLEILQSAPRSDVQQFFSSLQSLPAVERVTYLTREQLYAKARDQDPSLAAYLDKAGMQNPFPDTISVTLRSLDGFNDLSTFIAKPAWQNIVDPSFLSTATTQEKDIHSLLNIVQGGQTLTGLLLFLSGIVLLTTLVEITRLRAMMRADEVLVQRLVGAEMGTIFVPFAMETTILVWTGILVSALLVLVLLMLLPLIVPALAEGGTLFALRGSTVPFLWTRLPIILLVEVLLTPFLSALGAWLGIRPSIRSTTMLTHAPSPQPLS